MQKNHPRSDCPINFALEVFGDKWMLLIVRDIVYAGKRTHGEFLRSDERIATNILADRLARLECQGIITKAADPKDKRREIFSLTEKGLALIPLLLDLQSWSNEFGPAYIGRSAALEAALKKDREKVISEATERVRHGGFVFANTEWFPPRKAQ
ncbi:transcriptional regulator [Ktedonosporobacter rubrisoli]|uniref:Transcriptional regulator n=1 Tax=Ktedonosporobacter rubrisoli TaxID=2509675 RepID=A0A4P6JVE4_KTERU|nr:helix-turn-helix domain-containing protein [Ktedonosporobacter rubrisoli]QBD79627.1 transcriptional regulator [Ktedonosporobacter rubrisoli]